MNFSLNSSSFISCPNLSSLHSMSRILSNWCSSVAISAKTTNSEWLLWLIKFKATSSNQRVLGWGLDELIRLSRLLLAFDDHMGPVWGEVLEVLLRRHHSEKSLVVFFEVNCFFVVFLGGCWEGQHCVQVVPESQPHEVILVFRFLCFDSVHEDHMIVPKTSKRAEKYKEKRKTTSQTWRKLKRKKAGGN